MSVNKLAGICFIAGAILNFIPIIVGVLLGGNPEEGKPILDFFYQTTMDGGAQSRLFAWIGSLSAALLAYAVYTLNRIEQSKEKNALMGMGAFLIVFGSFGNALAWSIDISMLFGAESAVAGGSSAETANWFLLQFGIWINFGTIIWLGTALFVWSLVAKGYANDILLQVSAVVSIILILAFVNTLFNINFTSMASIMPMFATIMISTVLNSVWQILVGLKMID
ncbi:MAG TPA: hypothetical protein DGM69_00960 [Chloroflexi bacterium]|jgi:hypothetical protein|nr:hypothetical protein [Chloroflexota bacterium]|tara:strand:+ start:723 stop:1394 length:672 start_codon:yes stop_codon:yes gene_type:complete